MYVWQIGSSFSAKGGKIWRFFFKNKIRKVQRQHFKKKFTASAACAVEGGISADGGGVE